MLLEEGSVLLVSGGTGSIGSEVAAQAAAQGVTVAVHGSSTASCAKAIEALLARVPQGRFLEAPADFQDRVAIKAMVESVAERAGRLDAVIHCAAVVTSGTTGLFKDSDPGIYEAAVTRYIAPLQWLCHAALPHLMTRQGAIVTATSDSGHFAAPHQALIATTRAAAMAFTRNLGVEAARDGVRMNCVSMSYVDSGKIDPRYAAHAAAHAARIESARKKAGLGLPTPADIAAMMLFLCGPAAAKVTGQVISVNGGMNA
jgi:3-oxoacyl-[acyl-carrier protein] reductase